jgi:hypothetical protein
MRRSGSQNRRVRDQIDDLDIGGLEPPTEKRRANAGKSIRTVGGEQTYAATRITPAPEPRVVERAGQRIRRRRC